MKKILLFIMLCVFTMSCKNAGKIKELKGQNDSMVALLGKIYEVAPYLKTSLNSSGTMDLPGQLPFFSNIADTDSVTKQVAAWDSIAAVSQHIIQYTSCIIYKQTIDSAITVASVQNPNDTTVGIMLYLACIPGTANTSSVMRYYWQPVCYRSASQHFMSQYIKQGTKGYVMDHTLPCPKCGVDSAMVSKSNNWP